MERRVEKTFTHKTLTSSKSGAALSGGGSRKERKERENILSSSLILTGLRKPILPFSRFSQRKISSGSGPPFFSSALFFSLRHSFSLLLSFALTTSLSLLSSTPHLFLLAHKLLLILLYKLMSNKLVMLSPSFTTQRRKPTSGPPLTTFFLSFSCKQTNTTESLNCSNLENIFFFL